jgi:hypothetical protein
VFGLVVFAFLVAYNLIFHNVEIQETVSQWAYALYLWHLLSLLIIQGVLVFFLCLAIFGNARVIKVSPSEWFNNTVGSIGFILGSFSLYQYSHSAQNSQFLWVALIMYLVGFYYILMVKLKEIREKKDLN